MGALYHSGEKIVLIGSRLLLLILCGLLLSCQHNSEVQAEKKLETQKRNDAASYNVQLGMAYLKQGDIPRAKRKLLMAMDLTPDSPDANVAMAYYLEKTGDKSKAKTYYQKALALAPQNGSQLNNYGAFLCREGQYQEAEKYFLKAVNDVQYIHTAGAYENAGLCAEQIPDIPKAEAYFLKALEHDSQRKQSLYELVNLEMKQNKTEKALAYLQQYKEIVNSDAVLLTKAMDAAHETGRFDMEENYKQRLGKLERSTDYTGEKNEYDTING
ncbi:twitching motility protein PilF [Legionella birminghamensis]|uniref:Twitching motility protein PilF n=1 Tax=Legionella birminghamensis TaxID=28083 RepID=A0A378I8U8_9GAMM|nr:type IV pilus biogenesis/stability protein PilW [Legionella birminghamensis]KTC69375.1 twitching motility protein PilF [Legionella birminghamensis]STX31638.1 twitching motility protein PilF [Legionella birminghamensis]